MIDFKTYSKNGFSVDMPHKLRVKTEFPKFYAKAHGSFSSVVVEEILNHENLESLLRIPDPKSNIQNEIKIQKFEDDHIPLIGRGVYFSIFSKISNNNSYHYVLHGETESKRMYSVQIVLDEKYSMEILRKIVTSMEFE